MVDFALFHVQIGGNTFNWYVFNLADVAIVAGVAALLYDSFWGYPPQKRPDPGRYDPRVYRNVRAEHADAQDSEAVAGMMRCARRSQLRIVGSPARVLGCVVARHRPGDDGGAARAGDDDEDDKTFEEKIIDSIMTGIGATNMENSRHRLSRALAAGGAAQARSAAAGFRRRRGEGAELAEGSRRSAPQGRDRGPQEEQDKDADLASRARR